PGLPVWAIDADGLVVRPGPGPLAITVATHEPPFHHPSTSTRAAPLNPKILEESFLAEEFLTQSVLFLQDLFGRHPISLIGPQW
ncbi:MAG TPA: hypothetical protein VIL16_32700, partial [Trebonia sp.]